MDMYKIPLKKCLSEQARKFRKRMNVSQEKMAELLRMTPRAYGDLERGKFCFSAQTLMFLLSQMSEEEVRNLIDEFRETVAKIEPVKGKMHKPRKTLDRNAL